uniref:Putative exo1 n=1 Tax=Albugo laibachii Nc14 TaxID=890382 RepID=F0X1U3_9STRA|nr:putative exo1 [Albugo laibachii Nc14]|eukprot:CCA27797.1 putative exo1 [Albugo laibachii Nc14]
MWSFKIASQLLLLIHSVSESESDPLSDSNESQYAEWLWNRNDASDRSINGFLPHDANMTCTQYRASDALNRQVRGVNLGGLFVLEPWITPSLFYQFLDPDQKFGDQTPYKTAMDTFKFCEALGKEEANRQLRIHYANWVTETDIQQLAAAGVNSLRLPVGDWMFVTYEPYTGCTDGAIEHLDRVLRLAQTYKLQVLLDIHGHIGSQNGADNSGQQKQVEWTRLDTETPSYRFVHWPIRSADWVGKFDVVHQNYTNINYKHLLHSLKAVQIITERYATHPAVHGLETVNEPWQFTPLRILKEFYWRSYKVVKSIAPHWTFVMHDSFRFNPNEWRGFMRGCPGISLDTHFYLAWRDPAVKETFFSYACKEKSYIAQMENAIMPVIVGEWSLATDNCAMWLNGFNDNVPGYPKVKCSMIQCPVYGTYLGRGFPGLPLDITKASQGPFGTGDSGPSYGLCPISSNSSFSQEDDDHLKAQILRKQLNSWSVGHGYYFWNFRAELDRKWSFLELVERHLTPQNISSYKKEDEVLQACDQEDAVQIVCRARTDVSDEELKKQLAVVCAWSDFECSFHQSNWTLQQKCDWAYNTYWRQHLHDGVTCDFDSTAHLDVVKVDEKRNLATTFDIVSDQSTSWLSYLSGGLGVIVAVGLVVRFKGMYYWCRRKALRANYASI